MTCALSSVAVTKALPCCLFIQRLSNSRALHPARSDPGNSSYSASDCSNWLPAFLAQCSHRLVGFCFQFGNRDPEHRIRNHDPQLTESWQMWGQLQFNLPRCLLWA